MSYRLLLLTLTSSIEILDEELRAAAVRFVSADLAASSATANSETAKRPRGRPPGGKTAAIDLPMVEGNGSSNQLSAAPG
jgi:hypothetical protein